MANYDHYTKLAIKSIFLGARIHDAAVVCGKSDALMRREFLAFAKNKNKMKFDFLDVEAASNGYSTIPASYFQNCALDFISLKDIHPGFIRESLSEMSAVYEYIERSLAFATANLSIQRARRDSWVGAVRILEESNYRAP